ncbi:hypothetical protein U0035_01470 [Niabella yanshanensis]|uniref:Uncharacterized protein n=1 Tax=Niabella yanshanensis TaxID=577386 RepID=A0ABZ0W6E5_9BACT|nr:hypothetical protein [Niabella yanshanensis]WQD38812.1 hypothetical protein U0035_01470 [Niabella yanshanensis]
MVITLLRNNALQIHPVIARTALTDNHIIPDIHFKREVLQWQGLLYPQDLVQAQYGYFNLTQGVFPFFVSTHLPQDLRHQQWPSISIDYDDTKIPGIFFHR